MNTHIRLLTLSATVLLALTGVPRAAAPHDEQVASTEKPEVNEAAINNHPLHPGDSVAAIVNDSVISDYDVRQRMALFVATSGVRPTDNELKEIRTQVLKQLETERLELLEAQKNKISVSAEDVDKAIDNIMKENHLSMDNLSAMLNRSGVAMATFRGQIAAQIAWSKTVEDQYGDQVKVSDASVTAELARIASGAAKPHFLLSEIFLPVDNPEQDGKVLADAQNLENQIRQGAQFSVVARQFSQTPTAAQGGDLGVVVDGQLPAPELNAALDKLHPGEVSPPIRSTGGYYILYMRERQEGAGTKIPDASQIQTTNPDGSIPLVRLLLPIGTKPSAQLLKNATNVAETIAEHVTSCASLQEIATHVPSAQFFNLGNMKPGDMSADVKAHVVATPPGQPVPPFESAAGIELFVRCDKAVPKITAFHVPTREEVEQDLFEDQMSVLARRYLRDLRRDADIETR